MIFTPMVIEQSTKNAKFINSCADFAATILQKKPQLLTLLSHYETYEAAHDEIMRSVEALRNIKDELDAIKNPLSDLKIATFFPLNLPLYSLTLFAILPSIYTANVFVRPPEIVGKILAEICDLLEVNKFFPQVSLKVTPRHIFVDLYASESDVIIFTGKYENALAIQRKCPYSLMLYNGSGVNPFIVFENANLELAAKKAVEMRCFNSGQDCAGPDAFFVPTKLKDKFISYLKIYLQDIVVGSTLDKKTDVGPTMKQTYIDELIKWLEQHPKSLLYGGKIDNKNHYVYPTIATQAVRDYNETEFHEFFAPFFLVLDYSSDAELESIIHTPGFTERAMYVSVFGDNELVESKLTFVKVLKNQIVNDVERGNEEYGGYGPKANFILFGDQKIVQPILIGRDIHLMLAS